MVNDNDAPRLAVIGAGPGGYPASFFGAERGLQVTLIDPEPDPGGVCLYRGCIPSKALLHVARLIQETRDAGEWGVRFGEPEIDLDALRAWKDAVVRKMTNGLGLIRRQREVEYVQGLGRLRGGHTVSVQHNGEVSELEFDYAVLATGSSPVLPGAFDIDSPRVMDSTTALELPEIPERLLVVGGGYIGLEMGSVYAALGSKVTVVEMLPSILAGVDPDLVRILERRLSAEFEEILLKTQVAVLNETAEGIEVELSSSEVELETRVFDAVLVSVGRRPNTKGLGLESTQIRVNDRGFIETDGQRRSTEPSIFAIGDVAGEPMLAHKATHEARVAIEAIAGEPAAFDPLAIPAVVFTDPEIAWCGLTEAEALAKNMDVTTARFPWAASSRAATMDRKDGLTKLVLEAGTERVVGVGIVGPGAGELIGEGVLAVEMGARATDLAHSIHAHPTLSETLMESAEVFFGRSAHYIGRQR